MQKQAIEATQLLKQIRIKESEKTYLPLSGFGVNDNLISDLTMCLSGYTVRGTFEGKHAWSETPHSKRQKETASG